MYDHELFKNFNTTMLLLVTYLRNKITITAFTPPPILYAQKKVNSTKIDIFN